MVVKRFSNNGKEYEIHLNCDGKSLEVRAYCGKVPANGYSYHIALETAHDLEALAGLDAIKTLVAIAEEDVKQQRYEKLLEILKRTEE